MRTKRLPTRQVKETKGSRGIETMIFHYLKWNGKLIPDATETRSRQEAMNKSKDGSVWILQEQTPEAEIRTSQANKYLWGAVYPAFCPEHFDAPQEAHEHFTKEYLTQQDIVDLTEESLQKFTERLLKQSSQTHKPKLVKQDDKVIVVWVRSTASLTKRQFIDYTNKVIDFGSTLGIQFLPIEQTKEN